MVTLRHWPLATIIPLPQKQTVVEVCIFFIQENKMELIHLALPSRGLNVYCLNGSYHAKRTNFINAVTCPACIRIRKGKSTAAQEAKNVQNTRLKQRAE
jgi:hypothetical protein